MRENIVILIYFGFLALLASILLVYFIRFGILAATGKAIPRFLYLLLLAIGTVGLTWYWTSSFYNDMGNMSDGIVNLLLSPITPFIRK